MQIFTFDKIICMPRKKTKIALVDDMDIDQALLTHYIKTNKNYEILFYATNGFDLLQKLQHFKPDIIVIDIYMPLMDGLSTIEHLFEQKYDGKILCVTNGFEYNLIPILKQKNVTGFSRKNGKYVLKALDKIVDGKEHWDEEYLETYSTTSNPFDVPKKDDTTEPLISGKEIEIINLLANGLNSEEIYKHIGYSIFTIDAYIQNLTKRYNLKNRTHLVAYAYVHGLIDNFESFKDFPKPQTSNLKPSKL